MATRPGRDAPKILKGTETLITPATCPFTNRSLYDRARPKGLEHARGPLNRSILESQALKSWIACLTAGPMWNQSDREPKVPVHDGPKERCQVSGMI
jgi:hypothetical protein